MSTSPLPTNTNPVESGVTAYASIPTFGRSDEELQKNVDASEFAAKALEQRYQDPNWFNVAAGFLKPQLGGFAASLGSANQALSDWQEQKRANEIPVYNARAQVALMKARQTNNLTARDEYSKWVSEGSDLSKIPDLKSKFAALGAPEYSEALQQKLDQSKTLQSEANTTTELNLKKASELNAIILDPNVPEWAKNQAKEQLLKIRISQFIPPKEEHVKKEDLTTEGAPKEVPKPLASEIIGDTTPKSGAETLKQQNERSAKDKADARDYVTNMGLKARDAKAQFSELAGAYPLFSDPGVKLAMGRFDQGNLDSLLKTMLANQTVSPSVAAVAQVMPPGIEEKYPGTIAKVQQLIGLSAKQQLEVNNQTQNPNRQTNQLEKSVVFSPNDLAEVAARKTMLSLHNFKHVYQEANTVAPLYEKGKGLSEIVNSPDVKNVHNNWAWRNKMLTGGSLYKNLPTDLQSIDAPIPAAPKAKSVVSSQIQ